MCLPVKISWWKNVNKKGKDIVSLSKMAGKQNLFQEKQVEYEHIVKYL